MDLTGHDVQHIYRIHDNALNGAVSVPAPHILLAPASTKDALTRTMH